jgi:hypothetical protein
MAMEDQAADQDLKPELTVFGVKDTAEVKSDGGCRCSSTTVAYLAVSGNRHERL